MEKTRTIRKALHHQESKEKSPPAKASEEDSQGTGWQVLLRISGLFVSPVFFTHGSHTKNESIPQVRNTPAFRAFIIGRGIIGFML